jgi:CheY-like chemotaxis protein
MTTVPSLPASSSRTAAAARRLSRLIGAVVVGAAVVVMLGWVLDVPLMTTFVSSTRLLLQTHLRKWGHEPVMATDGAAAWEVLQAEDAPSLAILDWMMPGLAGVEVCRRARVSVGVRVVARQGELAARIADLEQALARVDQLHGIRPICSYCKKVRSDADSWHQVEAYVSSHSAVRFSHGVCPECVRTVMRPELEELKRVRALAEETKT